MTGHTTLTIVLPFAIVLGVWAQQAPSRPNIVPTVADDHRRFTDDSPNREFLVGGDISALAKIEESGGIFRDQGNPGDAIGIMAKHGCNCFRLRLFVNPTYQNVVVNDLPYTIALAKRIKTAGAKLLLNFHYSDTWADPGHQTKPEAWKDLDFQALQEKVYDYTRSCIGEFKNARVLPDFVQIGNEIAPGMLWPDGKLYGEPDPEQQWKKFARLLKAGVRGVKDAAGNQTVRIVIHIHCGGDRRKTERFFENIEKHHVPYDVIGLSYYPWWHGTLEELRDNLHNTAAKFDKNIFVVETAYPYRPLRYPNAGGKADKTMRWPQTSQGQAAFLEELVHTVRQTPNGRGLGVLWWYPESIPVAGLRVWHGGATAMFDEHGNVTPAMSVFQKHGSCLFLATKALRH